MAQARQDAEVQFSGASMASVVHSAAAEMVDMEGLLIGSLKTHERGEIGDNFDARSTIVSTFFVTSILPTPRTFSFYDAKASVDVAKVKDLAKDCTIIGWFKCRRNSSNQPSLYEHHVHKSLAQELGKDPKELVFSLFVANQSDNKATHSFKYTCWRMKQRTLHSLPGVVVNLGADGAEKPAYSSSGDVYDLSNSTMDIVTPLGDAKGGRSELVKTMESSYQRLLKRITQLGKDVVSSDREIRQEQRKISELQIRIREKRKKQHQAKNAQPADLPNGKKKSTDNPFKIGKSKSVSPPDRRRGGDTNPFAAAEEVPRSQSATDSSRGPSVDL